MTPLRGILRLIKGDTPKNVPAPAGEPASVAGSRNRRDAASPATGGGPILTDDPKKRRRGRRGGRKRSQATTPPEGAAEAAHPANGRSGNGRAKTASNGRTSAEGRTRANGSDRNGRSRSDSPRGQTDSPRGQTDSSRGQTDSPKGQPTRDRYEWGRRVDSDEADQRSRQANRRRRGIRRADLDAPLPEDVAFRPGDEGGDSTILPTRRRRPVGFHDTARTLVGGARSLGTWVKRDVRHGHEADYTDEVETATVEPAAENADRSVDRAARQLLVAPKAEPTADTPTTGTRPDEAAGTAEVADNAPAAPDTSTDTSTDTDEDATERPRRRRGRRGGRGRRRPDAASAEATDEPSEDELEDGEPEDTEPEDTEPEDLAADIEADHDEADDRSAPESDEDREERPRRERRPAAGRRATFAPIPDDQLPTAFAALGVNRTSLEQLARFGFALPTPIQEEAIPALLNGLDVVGIAQTGSGKTIAFSLPMVEKLDPELAEVQGLVMVPTRELAQQVLDVLTEVAAPWGLEAVGLLGGRSLRADFKALEQRPHIVVGTPGRVLDHLRRQTLSLRHVRYAVLDEADQMLDIGFLPDIRRILSRTPQRRQTALFSATMPTSIRRLIWQFMTDPETVRVDPEATTVDTIEQIYFEVAQRDKVRAMRELIERELKGRSLIFCNMKRSVDHLARELGRDGVSVRALHGDLDQRQRDRVVQEFRAGQIDAVIATNVAARGLDIPEITHVVNYDVPQNLDEYVHRIGRTGRAGREGKALTFVSEWDVDAFDEIRAGVPSGIRREQLDLYGPASPKPAADADGADAAPDDPDATPPEAELGVPPADDAPPGDDTLPVEDALPGEDTPPVEDTAEAIPVTRADG